MYNNEKEQGIDNYEDEGNRYVPLPFTTPYPPSYKELNHLTDLGERIKRLNHFVYILKISKTDNC